MNVFVANGNGGLHPAGATGQDLSVDGTVRTFTALPESISHALVSVKAYAVLVTFDGSDPASSGTKGLLYTVGSGPHVWTRYQVNAARLVELTGGQPGVVRVEPMGA